MKETNVQISNFTIAYPLENQMPLEKALFIDIETTGFTARSSYLYLIGCAYYQEGCWNIRQWFAENYNEEATILNSFFVFAKNYTHLIHFNGNNFDLPYILQKCQQLDLPYNFDHFEGVDIYRRIAPYRHFLKLPNCKQKTLEQFLGIDREDIYNGGELISFYHEYVRFHNEEQEQALLLHNEEDVKGMLELLPILAYYDTLNSGLRAKKAQASIYKDISGNKHQELLLTVALPVALPKEITVSGNGCYFKGSGQEGQIRVPIWEGELKYFYSNYKDYYYLPAEDTALHKSVAGFVDKDHRVQATAATCYTRKISTYLPQWDTLVTPFFKRDYNEKEMFFELTEEIKKDRQAFSDYANHILDVIAAHI